MAHIDFIISHMSQILFFSSVFLFLFFLVLIQRMQTSMILLIEWLIVCTNGAKYSDCSIWKIPVPSFFMVQDEMKKNSINLSISIYTKQMFHIANFHCKFTFIWGIKYTQNRLLRRFPNDMEKKRGGKKCREMCNKLILFFQLFNKVYVHFVIFDLSQWKHSNIENLNVNNCIWSICCVIGNWGEILWIFDENLILESEYWKKLRKLYHKQKKNLNLKFNRYIFKI